MAGAARIGAVHVMLGLDSAQFQAGLAKAQAGLGKFAQAAKIGFAVVAAAAVAAGTALAVAVKGAIDHADELSKSAQKAGITTEALSQLEYAAKLSDVSLETLTSSLGKLSKAMLDVAQGQGQSVKLAFDALGISVTDVDGKLRSSESVLGDIADRFFRMENGAAKTALAMQLFGKSGAQLIPFLNMGRDGIAELTAEADRLGLTLSTSTGQAAEQFNDTITTMQSTFDGIIRKIMEAVLPSLNEFGDLLASPRFAEAAQQITVGIVSSMQTIIDAVMVVVDAFNKLRETMEWLGTHDMFGNEIAGPGAGNRMLPGSANKADALEQLKKDMGAGKSTKPGAGFYNGIFGASASDTAAGATAVATAFEPLITNTQAATAAASALKAVMAEGKAVFTATRTPAEAYSLEVERLNGLLAQGAIDQETYNRAVTQAQDAFTKAERSGDQLASTLADGLANVFSSVVDGSKSAVDAIGDLLKSLSQLLIHKAFEGFINAIFPTGIKIGANANGTNNWRGGLTMVGERGPELVNLPRGSQVIPNKDLNQNGSSAPVIAPQYHISGVGLTQEQLSEVMKKNNRDLINSLPDQIAAINRDPRKRRAA